MISPLLLKADVTHQEVVDAIQAAGVKRLTDIKLFDVFSGEKLGLGMKSMAYSLTFQNPEDSLTDEEVARYMEKIQASLEEKSMQKYVKNLMKQLRHALSCFLFYYNLLTSYESNLSNIIGSLIIEE